MTQDGKKKVSYLVNWELFTFWDRHSGLFRWQCELGAGGGRRQAGEEADFTRFFFPGQVKLQLKERGQYLFKSISLSVCLCPHLFSVKGKTPTLLLHLFCIICNRQFFRLYALLLPMKCNFKAVQSAIWNREKRQVVFSSFTGEFFSSRAIVNFLSFYFLLSHFRIVVDKFYLKNTLQATT